jgi:hypothetical protein
MPGRKFAALTVLILALLNTAGAQGLHGTLVIAVPVSQGLVACADKRLFNDSTGKTDDTFVKIRKVNKNTLFVATNTVGFLDKANGKLEFDVYDIVEKYTSAHDFNSASFWNGLKDEIRKQLLAYLRQRKFPDWPETDKANNNLLFNLVFYSTAGSRARSYSFTVFYERAQVPLITMPGVVSEEVRTPKLSGKGKEVMVYLSQNPAFAQDPAILRFDESRFDITKISVADAVNFAKTLFSITNSAVPQAEVSSKHDCALIGYQTGFRWLNDAGLPVGK